MIFITHNPHHAYPVGDRFVVLNRGQMLGSYAKGEIDQTELVRLMAGGIEVQTADGRFVRFIENHPRNRDEYKEFRRIATRYEKLRDVFLGLVRLVFGFIHVKKIALSVNTP